MKIPNHVAIIMDGNGRWATRQNKNRSEGHLAGSKALKKLTNYVMKKGIKVLSVFAFSTENFNRPIDEVNYLMELFVKHFKANLKVFKENNIKVVFSGRSEPLNEEVLKVMRKIEKETENNNAFIFNICLNYGGQSEIVDATKKIVLACQNGEITLNDINEKTYYRYLYQDLPPVDLLIRTSGEMRISNFMLYSLSYSEFYFSDVLFPDFDEKEFDRAIEAYQGRQRRFGKVVK